MRDETRKAYPHLKVRLVLEDFRLDLGDGDVIFSLDRAYAHYRGATSTTRGEVIRLYVESVRMAIDPRAVMVVENLYPTVRDRYSVETRGVVSRRGDVYGPYPSVPLGEHLAVALVFVSGSATSWATHASLAEMGLEFSEALEVATANLAKLPWRQEEYAPGVWAIDGKGPLGSALMLFTDRIRETTGSDVPVAMVPDQTTILVANPDIPGAVEELVASGLDVLPDEDRVSAQTFRFVAGAWQPYLADEPRVRAAALNARKLEESAFANLQAEQYKDAPDIIPGPRATALLAYFVPDRGVTCAIWGEENVLLPEVDLVAIPTIGFGPKASGIVWVPWDRAKCLAAGLLEPVECYPKRYRTLGIPDAEIIEKLVVEAVEFGEAPTSPYVC